MIESTSTDVVSNRGAIMGGPTESSLSRSPLSSPTIRHNKRKWPRDDLSPVSGSSGDDGRTAKKPHLSATRVDNIEQLLQRTNSIYLSSLSGGSDFSEGSVSLTSSS